jgi:hypothetical protein
MLKEPLYIVVDSNTQGVLGKFRKIVDAERFMHSITNKENELIYTEDDIVTFKEKKNIEIERPIEGLEYHP